MLVRQSLRKKPPFGEPGDPPLVPTGHVLYEEEFRPVSPKARRREQRQPHEHREERRIARVSSKKELADADAVERMIIEASQSKHQRRRSSPYSSENSNHIDRLLQDGNNDWFFEKLLSKFDSLRARPASHTSNDLVYDGVERIVERRYYVKKANNVPKVNQLTSTTDLTRHSRKHRELSGTSSVTEATIACSQCSSSTPSYVEQLRDQSDSLREEISELKSEIEQLQSSQERFFRQLQEQLRPKTDLTNVSLTSTRPTPSERDEPPTKPVLPLRKPQPTSPSPSETPTSASSSSSPASSTLTSRRTTRDSQTIGQPRVSPSAKTNTPAASIAEFMPSRHSSFASTTPSSIPAKTKTPSIPSTSPVTEFIASRNTSMATTPSTVTQEKTKTPSVVSTPPATEFSARQNSSVNSGRPAANRALSNTSRGSILSRESSIGQAASFKGQVPIAPPLPAAFQQRQTNELTHRRVLSPRSQIVASSAILLESSDASSESGTPTHDDTQYEKIPELSTPSLGDLDMKDLVLYSSQLEHSGYAPLKSPIISNPNSNSTFWESVDHYIESNRPANQVTGRPPVAPSTVANRSQVNPNARRQLDKYDLEIKPRETFESSAPLLMPPLDFSPSGYHFDY